ncbi:MAG: hypothetical protein ACRD3O_23510 [Terriglobia bacterium]
MRRWLFVIVLFGILLCVGCGLGVASEYSAVVESIALRFVPAVFVVGSIAGLSLYRQG